MAWVLCSSGFECGYRHQSVPGGAIGALQVLSAEPSRIDKPAGSPANEGPGLSETNKQPSQSVEATSGAKGQSKKDVCVTTGTPNRKPSDGCSYSAGQMQPATQTAGSSQVSCSAANASQKKSAPSPCGTPDQTSQDYSRRLWYMMASMWGAVFTYILSPLVLDVLRRFIIVEPKPINQRPSQAKLIHRIPNRPALMATQMDADPAGRSACPEGNGPVPIAAGNGDAGP
jgi:hypothetical protein